ncbi:hypothetical protein Tco_1132806 [Tanacetum coccineum]|uniref:Uncharacterized protein n=1 Tax=Tanacetum coccineum TaxID=301880 RepID=A0ABQ5JD01_9ASTR
MELMTPDLMCPSTHQLLWSSGGGSGPDVSFDKSASLDHFFGTDISKIKRKPSKTGKHRHGKRKCTREAKDAKPKPGKVKKSKLWSTSSQPWSAEVNLQKDKTPKCFKSTLQVSKVSKMVP